MNYNKVFGVLFMLVGVGSVILATFLFPNGGIIVQDLEAEGVEEVACEDSNKRVIKDLTCLKNFYSVEQLLQLKEERLGHTSLVLFGCLGFAAGILFFTMEGKK